MEIPDQPPKTETPPKRSGSAATVLTVLLTAVVAVVIARGFAFHYDASDLNWSVSRQAGSHVTVLALMATATAIFLYMVFVWSMQRTDSFAIFNFNAAAGLTALLIALLSFGAAAIACAVIAGWPYPDSPSPLGLYAIMVNINILYFWGLLLASFGGMLIGRLLNIGLGSKVRLDWMILGVGIVGLVVMHAQISVILASRFGSRLDWLLASSVAVILYGQLIARPFKLENLMEVPAQCRRVAVTAAFMMLSVLLIVIAMNVGFMNFASVSLRTLPMRWIAWYFFFYLFASPTIALLAHLQRITASDYLPATVQPPSG